MWCKISLFLFLTLSFVVIMTALGAYINSPKEDESKDDDDEHDSNPKGSG